MTDQAKQESQKTIVAFVAGLLIGGLLVYVFASPKDVHVDETTDEATIELTEGGAETDETDANETDEITVNTKGGDAPAMETGAGAIRVSDQAAGSVVKIDGATFPNDEGWIGVRDYTDGQLGRILGVARFSKEQGLVPTEVPLQRATEGGKEYALVFYTESGDRNFSLADDQQTGDVIATFTAN